MEDVRREELRRLALWLARRRDVDEVVERLTAYGPAASERVHTHLDALKALLDAEHEAFAALEREAPRVAQAPLPPPLEPVPGGATVHSMAEARRRQS